MTNRSVGVVRTISAGISTRTDGGSRPAHGVQVLGPTGDRHSADLSELGGAILLYQSKAYLLAHGELRCSCKIAGMQYGRFSVAPERSPISEKYDGLA